MDNKVFLSFVQRQGTSFLFLLMQFVCVRLYPDYLKTELFELHTLQFFPFLSFFFFKERLEIRVSLVSTEMP